MSVIPKSVVDDTLEGSLATAALKQARKGFHAEARQSSVVAQVGQFS